MITDVFADLRQKLRDSELLKNVSEPQKEPNPDDLPVYLSLQVDGQHWSGWYPRKSEAIQAIRARIDEIEQTGVDVRKELKACEMALERLDPEFQRNS